MIYVKCSATNYNKQSSCIRWWTVPIYSTIKLYVSEQKKIPIFFTENVNIKPLCFTNTHFNKTQLP